MLRIISTLACLLFCFCIQLCYADTPEPGEKNDSLLIASTSVITGHSTGNDLPVDSIKASKKENKKLIAAILAFPLPFGVLGLHRIYLGTKPYMPFVYLVTIGGCIGILPFIDFITILSTQKEDLKNFECNPKVFMWSR